MAHSDTMTAIVDEYLDGQMDSDDVFPCKGCGEILEEGKAFELAGNRWHLDCFRCNTCSTLLDSDANLLLLGDGSLICNNCTYSCSACGNKIEDLAILTGDQAFCSTCFRCRNCKRKIENLRYARTSQGIFCMGCHETLMARRRKKSRAAAAAKTQKDGSSPMIKDKVLPALPPNMTEGYTGEPPQDSPNELSPRMRSGSRSNDTPPRAIPARSPERPTPTEQPTKSDSLMLPSSAYRKNRNSALIGSPDGKTVDPVELYGSLVRDSSPSAGGTPASGTDRRKESDYFPTSRSSGSDNREGSQASTPHIAFQEKSREPSSDSVSRPGLRRHSKSDKMSPEADEFKMTDISKTRALASSRSNSLSASGTPEVSASSKFNNGPSPRRPSNYQRVSHDGTSDEGTSAVTSPDLSKGSLKSEPKAFARKELPQSSAMRSQTGPPDAYTRPRNAPAPPGSRGSMQGNEDDLEPKHSPKLPRWSSGADFSLDEDMARILGTDEGSSSLLRRVSNVVRHGRSGSAESHQLNHRISHSRSISETTRTTMSPRWPKSPIREGDGADGMNPMSMKSMEEATILKRQLRNSENRVAELERRFDTEKDLQNLNRTLTEKRKTVSALDTQAELMIKQLEVLGVYVERAKATKTPINARDLEDSAIRDFVQRLEAVKQNMAGEIHELHQKRAQLLEERELAMADRDRALMEFEQLSSKNAQLADMNNDLTHQIQGRFKSQVNDMKNSNGLGIYANSRGASSGVNVDTASMSTGPTLIADDDTIVETGPTVVQVRKGQVKKFNWKKGSKAMAQNMAKGMNRAVVAFQNDRERIQQQGLVGGDIGMPYNATVAHAELISTPTSANGNGRPGALEPGRQGFGFFGKKNQMPKSVSANTMPNSAAAEPASVLFGSELTDRADFEHRQIPSVVTRCIEEVELRGMDQEGIYRKTGGNSQVNAIKDGFDRDENFDISDTDLDITAVTSVLKQYFRKLPTPLLTFDVYDNVLESNAIADETERCDHLRKTFAALPQSHRDCLEFLMFHLRRVAEREPENLMSPKNLAVVFAPTIMRDTSIEREMTDMHAKNLAIQFVIENSHTIFEEV